MKPTQIPFEIHLTIAAVSIEERDRFVAVCRALDAKPILIELSRGNVISQPMLTKVVHAATLQEVHDTAAQISTELEAAGFFEERRKIEVPAFYCNDFPNTNFPGHNYFEWHGKVQLTREMELRTCIEKHTAHLSRNAINGNAGIHFITLREYYNETNFVNRVQALVDELERNNWPLLKQHHEYCIYDNYMGMDAGWLLPDLKLPEALDDDLSITLESIAHEAFLRRAATLQTPVMLKGSYVTRAYFADPKLRIPADLDWVYMEPLDDPQTSDLVLSDWLIAVTNTIMPDGVVFRDFRKNQFWRRIDYAMADDFPTVNTDILCWVNGNEVEFTLDVSFNLDIEYPPVPLTYYPLSGNAFVIANTVQLALQVSWKIHQTLVRPRFKDMFDLMALVAHPDFTDTTRQQAMQALINECAADKIPITRLEHFFNYDIKSLFRNQAIEINWDWWRHRKDARMKKDRWGFVRSKSSSADIGLVYDAPADNITNEKLLPADLLSFIEQFKNTMEAAGFNSQLMTQLPTVTRKSRGGRTE